METKDEITASKFDDVKVDELSRLQDFVLQREIDARAKRERDARIEYELQSQIAEINNVQNKAKRLELRSRKQPDQKDLVKWCQALTHDNICTVGAWNTYTSFSSFKEKYEDQLQKAWLFDRENARDAGVIQDAYRQFILVRYTTADEWFQLGCSEEARTQLLRARKKTVSRRPPRRHSRRAAIAIAISTSTTLQKQKTTQGLQALYKKWHKDADPITSKYYKDQVNRLDIPGSHTYWSPAFGLAMFVSAIYQRMDSEQKRFVQQFYMSNTRGLQVYVGIDQHGREWNGDLYDSSSKNWRTKWNSDYSRRLYEKCIQPRRLFTGPLRIIARFLMTKGTDFRELRWRGTGKARHCFMSGDIDEIEQTTTATEHIGLPRGRCCTEKQKPCGPDRVHGGTCKGKCMILTEGVTRTNTEYCRRCPYMSCPHGHNTCHCPPEVHKEFGCETCSARDCPWQNVNHYLNDKNPADASWCPSCRIHTEDEKNERLAYLEEWRYKRLYRQVQWENRQHFMKQDALAVVQKKLESTVNTISTTSTTATTTTKSTTTVTTKRKRFDEDKDDIVEEDETEESESEKPSISKTTTKSTKTRPNHPSMVLVKRVRN